MQSRSFNWWNQSALTLTPYEEAIRRLKAVGVPSVDVYRDIRSIETVFPTIDLYLEEIERIIKCLENDSFYKPKSPFVMGRVRRQSFYLTREGMYLDVEEVHRRFINRAIYLLSLYERRELEPNKSGLLQSNLHRAVTLINNLMDLSQGL